MKPPVQDPVQQPSDKAVVGGWTDEERRRARVLVLTPNTSMSDALAMARAQINEEHGDPYSDAHKWRAQGLDSSDYDTSLAAALRSPVPVRALREVAERFPDRQEDVAARGWREFSEGLRGATQDEQAWTPRQIRNWGRMWGVDLGAASLRLGRVGGRDAWDALGEKGLVDYLPFVSGLKHTAADLRVLAAARKVQAGSASPDDEEIVYTWAEQELARANETWAAGATDIATSSVPFVLEFMATAGAFSAGRAATQRALGGLAESLAGRAVAATVGAGVQATVAGTASGRIVDSAASRILPEFVEYEDGGGWGLLMERTEGSLLAELPAGVATEWTEYLSERTGGVVGKVTGPIAERLVASRIAQLWLRSKPGRTLADLARAVTSRGGAVAEKAGWHGVLGEVFEERTGEAMRAALQLEEWEVPGWRQITQELAAFAATGTAVRGAGALAGAGQDRGIVETADGERIGLVGPVEVQGTGGGDESAAEGGADTTHVEPTGAPRSRHVEAFRAEVARRDPEQAERMEVVPAPDTIEGRGAEGFGRLIGREVVFVQDPQGGPLPVSGAHTGEAIVLDAADPRPVEALLYHEAVHASRQDDPEGYEALVAALPEAAVQRFTEDYRRRFGREPAESQEEGVATMAENMPAFIDYARRTPGELARLAEEAPTFLQRLRDVLVRWSNKLLGTSFQESGAGQLRAIRDRIASTDFERTADPAELARSAEAFGEAVGRLAEIAAERGQQAPQPASEPPLAPEEPAEESLAESEGAQPAEEPERPPSSRERARESHKRKMRRYKSGEGVPLSTFLRAHGGVSSEGVGELWDRHAPKERQEKSEPGLGRLVHPPGSGRGMHWDMALERAHEAGYFAPYLDRGDLSMQDLLDAIDADTMRWGDVAPEVPFAAGAAPPLSGQSLQSIAASVPAEGRFGAKVFLRDLYEAAVADGYPGSWEAFSNELVRLNRAREISLSRADLVPAMDAERVVASEVRYLGARFNFMRTEPGARFAAAYHGSAAEAKFAARPTGPDAAPDDSTIGRVHRYLVDNWQPAASWQEGVEADKGEQPAERNPTQKFRLFRGRAKFLLRDRVEPWAEELANRIREGGWSREQLEAYLIARHASERNAAVAKINQRMQPDNNPGAGAIRWKGKEVPATDGNSADILRQLKRDLSNWSDLEAFGARWDAMNRERLDMQRDAGLLSEEVHAALAEAYQHWAPLRTMKEDDWIPHGVGQGLDVRGQEFKRAFGRTTAADRPIETALNLYGVAAVRVAKAEPAQALYRMLQEYPDVRAEVTVDEAPKKRVLGSDGTVTEIYDRAAERDENVVGAKVDGKLYFIRFKPEHLSVAQAFKRAKEEGLESAVVQAVGKVNRAFAAMVTRYSPFFLPLNPIRDALHAFALTGVEQDVATGAKVVASIPSAFRALMGRGGRLGKRLREWEEVGGPISYLDLTTYQDVARELVDKATQPLDSQGLRQQAIRLKRWFDAASDVLEQATRLAVYATMRDKGWAKERAAIYSKEITVNFEQHGNARWLNAFYAFSNVALVSNHRLWRAARRQPVRMAGALASIAAGGMGAAMLARLLMGDDDDGIPHWEKLSDFERENYIIIPFGEGEEHGRLPLPHVFRWFWGSGVQAVDVLAGRRTVGDMALSRTGALLDETNPLGDNQSPLMALSPTVVDPFAEIYANSDFAGRPIYPEGFPGQHAADASTHWPDASGPSKALAAFLNAASGGDEFEGGAMDVHPDSIDHAVSYFSGGVGRFFMQLAQGAQTLREDRETSVSDWPVLNVFVRGKNHWEASSRFRRNLDRIDLLEARYERLRDQGQKDEARDLRRENMKLWLLRKRAEVADKRVRELRNQLRATDDIRRQLDVEAEIELVMRAFNGRVYRATEGRR